MQPQKSPHSRLAFGHHFFALHMQYQAVRYQCIHKSKTTTIMFDVFLYSNCPLLMYICLSFRGNS